MYNRFNLTKKERQAIKSLSQNPNIIIKLADKGGAIVIQDKHKYIEECLRQLNNKEHYKKLHYNTLVTLELIVKIALLNTSIHQTTLPSVTQ